MAEEVSLSADVLVAGFAFLTRPLGCSQVPIGNEPDMVPVGVTRTEARQRGHDRLKHGNACGAGGQRSVFGGVNGGTDAKHRDAWLQVSEEMSKRFGGGGDIGAARGMSWYFEFLVQFHYPPGKDQLFLGRQLPQAESGPVQDGLVRELKWEVELNGQTEGDVEELWTQQKRIKMGGEMGDVEAPQDGALDLGAALATDLVEVGVVPKVFERRRESAISVEQARTVGDGSPAIDLVLGVDREPYPNVASPMKGSCMASPGTRNLETRRYRRVRFLELNDGTRCRVMFTKIRARDDHRSGGAVEPETFQGLLHSRTR